ncbi:MAG: UDP-N-acetylmuramoyl-L-alanine--D-glutamate ligase [Candidatus Dadabacteria bacterium]|nr:UDP-N-acetylmuramoyl-L-alanine--D-glutamate ligase [Candidatus Dadabacteria bacterium]
MELQNRKILVVGLGKTGMDSVNFLLDKGAQVRVSDSSPIEKIGGDIELLESKGVKVEAGKHTAETFLWAETIVLSPGVPFKVPQVQMAMAQGIEVISEVELAWRFIKTPIIAITGSNGKTTTSTLIARILERNGQRVYLGANIGTPLIRIAEDSDKFDILVLELSSFQLQGIQSFSPDIAIILNISPNHLDHHESFDEYVESKMKIYSNQTGDDWFVYNKDDEVINGYLPRVRSRKVPFGKDCCQDGVTYRGSEITFRDHVYDVEGIKLIGSHNVENIMAAIAGTTILGCDPIIIQEGIKNFEPLPHRNEYVREIEGAKFYNDSKSTSPAATVRALESLPCSIILIAGGKDKGVSFEPLKDLVREKVRFLILIGESKLRMKQEIGVGIPSVLADSLKEALDITLQNLTSQDSVLFSPACSSFDMFNSYEERGMKFKEIVENI